MPHMSLESLPDPSLGLPMYLALRRHGAHDPGQAFHTRCNRELDLGSGGFGGDPMRPERVQVPPLTDQDRMELLAGITPPEPPVHDDPPEGEPPEPDSLGLAEPGHLFHGLEGASYMILRLQMEFHRLIVQAHMEWRAYRRPYEREQPGRYRAAFVHEHRALCERLTATFLAMCDAGQLDWIQPSVREFATGIAHAL